MTDPSNPASRPPNHAAAEPASPGPSAGSASPAATTASQAPASSPAAGPGPAGGAAQLAWLHQELDRQLSAYRRRRRRDKRKAFVLQMATVTLSAAITVLLGLRTTGTTQQRLADIALVFGAVITVLAAAEAFFAHRGLWILRTHTVRRLETLARHLDYQQTRADGHPLKPTTLDHYATELDDILNEDHTRWQQLRATTPDSRNPSASPNNTPSSTP